MTAFAKTLLIGTIVCGAANAVGKEGGAALAVELLPIYQENIPSEVEHGAISSQINALKLTIENTGDIPVRLLWGDFFIRTNGGPWIGGWWGKGKPEHSKLTEAFGRDGVEEGLGLVLPPDGELKCILSDPWVNDNDHTEYKFAALFYGDDGKAHLVESSAVEASPLKIDNAGVLRAVNGISEAIGNLFEPWDVEAEPIKAGEFGVTVEHVLLGPVEAMKNDALTSEIRQSQKVGSGDNFYAYRTEIANNTTHPVEVVLLEVLTRHQDQWLSGAMAPAVRSQTDIIKAGYIQGLHSSGVPKVKKMRTATLQPGERVVLPSNWHPHYDYDDEDDMTQARWRAVLIGERGKPLYVYGDTPPERPNLFIPKSEGVGDE
jgi:hypothetical protein